MEAEETQKTTEEVYGAPAELYEAVADDYIDTQKVFNPKAVGDWLKGRTEYTEAGIQRGRFDSRNN